MQQEVGSGLLVMILMLTSCSQGRDIDDLKARLATVERKLSDANLSIESGARKLDGYDLPSGIDNLNRKLDSMDARVSETESSIARIKKAERERQNEDLFRGSVDERLLRLERGQKR